MSIFRELKRRNVFKVAIAYLIVGWLLLQISDTLVPALRLPGWFHSGVAFFVIIGFPIALIFAWAFEITPEGLKKEKDVERSRSITHITGRKIDYIIIAVLILALGFFAFDKFVLDPSRDAELVQATTQEVLERASKSGKSEIPEKSIAVLAFTDLSPEGDQEYFSDGISEEILNVLARIPDLHVTSRSSAFTFKGKGLDIPTVAEQLGVAHILEGSVRKAGTRIRITAQLIDARTDKHLWSGIYDRELDDIFAVQDEISAAIVEALKKRLGLQVESPPKAIAAKNTEAYDAYLRGRHLVVQRTRATIEGSIRELEKAIALDPEYALAHAELAIATLLLRRGQYGGLTITEAIARAAPHADKALVLEPTLAEAHAATGFVLWVQGNLEEALTQFRLAIQINPNYAIVYNWMGIVLDADLGRYAEGFAMKEMALRLDPLSIPAIFNYVGALIERNRLDEANREQEKLASIAPRFYASAKGLRTSLGGKWADAVLAELDGLQINPESAWSRDNLTRQFAMIGLEQEALAISNAPLPEVLSMLGRPAEAVTTAEALLAKDPVSLAAHRRLGLALAGAGDYARAQPILEEMWRRSGGWVTSYGLFRNSSAVALIAIRRAAGDEAEANELVVAIADNVRRYREAEVTGDNISLNVDYEEGLVAYLAGERVKGFALIDQSVEDGFFIPQKEAYLQELYDEPAFAPIKAKQEVRMARERERFLTIVCTDNPHAVVWQPSQGTCERFAAAGRN